MNIPVLETPRLMLRAWAPEDAEAWHRIVCEDGILQYFPNPRPPERARADGYISQHAEHWKVVGYGHWAVVTRDDQRVLGWTGLEYLPELKQVEVAYLLSRSAWGNGYATEAARAAVRFGFETCNLDEIIGLVHPENAGSIRVLEKCGMTRIDRVTLWGLEMWRYGIARADYDVLRRDNSVSARVQSTDISG